MEGVSYNKPILPKKVGVQGWTVQVSLLDFICPLENSDTGKNPRIRKGNNNNSIEY